MRDLAASGIPAEVSLRVLGLGRSPYYRWLIEPITESELVDAYLANATFDAHRDDSEFGYGSSSRKSPLPVTCGPADSVADLLGQRVACVFGRNKRGKKARVETPADDDLVRGALPPRARTSCGSRT